MPHTAGTKTDEPLETRQVANVSDPSDVALDIGFKVIAERLTRIQSLIVYTGITARKQYFVDLIGCACLTPFGQGKWQEPEKRRSSRERLADRPGQFELPSFERNLRGSVSANWRWSGASRLTYLRCGKAERQSVVLPD